MTATDELRRMLDERGVEWDELVGHPVVVGTEWHDRDGYPCIALEHADDVPDGMLSVQANLTPAQAIEATLGRGTCRNLIAHMQGQMPMLHCEECGCTTTLNVPSDGAGYIGETAMDWPLYCANCGRRVVAGDGE